MSGDRWAIGDTFGLAIPADAETLGGAGIAFLDNAFRRFGILATDNRISEITRFEPCAGGSTGRKLLLGVRYSRAQPGLPEDLFVKFSRDFDNPRRDRGKSQMDLEVRFAILSRGNAFPIHIPFCAFADYERDSGTGILITERIPYGRAPVEPHYDKCLDYRMPDPLAHYEALLASVARLAGAHRAGRLAPEFSSEFAYDPARVTVGERVPCPPGQLQDRVACYESFATEHPGLLPTNIRTAEFFDRLRDEVGRIAALEDAVMAELTSAGDLLALCHWNANVDNAWFWRDPDGRMQCGLLDWGCVSEMNVAMPLWGALCSAETAMWDRHLDHLLTHFVAEFVRAGGPALDVTTVRCRLMSYAAVMGVAWLLDAPAYIRAVVPDLDGVADRHDPRISANEVARTQLQMLTNFLNLWQAGDFDGLLTQHT